MKSPLRVLLVVLWLAAGVARGADQPKTDSPEEAAVAAASLLASLKPQQGEITLQSGLAKAVVPDGFKYLDAKDAEKVLVKLWGNPPGEAGLLGMIYPSAEGLLSDNSWAVILQYDEDGHVKDDDAAKIDYASLLQKMQKGVQEGNKERIDQGYAPLALVGWALPPRYDPGTHKLYWAKELKFGDSTNNTLNYNFRMLGRRGVLIVNAVSSMERLKDIEAATPQILAMVDFNPGHRYQDFDAKSDKVAAYGLAALIAGGVAAKAGLFKGLLVALVAAKKFILIGFMALVAFARRVFTGRKSQS